MDTASSPRSLLIRLTYRIGTPMENRYCAIFLSAFCFFQLSEILVFFFSPMPTIFSSCSGSLSRTQIVFSPNSATIFFASEGPHPATTPLARYSRMPSFDVGSILSKAAHSNCGEPLYGFPHSPYMTIRVPLAMSPKSPFAPNDVPCSSWTCRMRKLSFLSLGANLVRMTETFNPVRISLLSVASAFFCSAIYISSTENAPSLMTGHLIPYLVTRSSRSGQPGGS